MTIDFGKLGGKNIADEAIEPRKIFTALSRGAKYAYPRDVQSQVWEDWYRKRDKKDLVIKMNTGSGKTVVGLLILKSCLNEKMGPAVFFTPDKYLTDQVLLEAGELGIPVTTSERSIDFISGKAILVTNIHKLFNGKSVFGVGQEGIKIPIGSFVIDDAHACINVIREKFTLRFNSVHAAYQRLWPVVSPALNGQSVSKTLEVENSDPTAQMRVPFWTWQKEIPTITSVLHTYRDDNEFSFTWPLIKDSLSYCQCMIGGGVIEISPTTLPVHVIPAFQAAKRKIFMSATIADETILLSDLKADFKSLDELVVPNSADDLGDRMIIFPQQANPKISEDEIKKFLLEYSQKYNVVVLVPSENRAKFWAKESKLVLNGDNISSGVESLKTTHVGLVVMVNRYDGVDLPGDAARILVIDGLPRAQSLREKNENAILHQSEAYLEKQIGRIEQGMGRGTRSNDDYCVVLLMGNDLTHLLYSQKSKRKFSPATLAQLELAEKLGDQIKDKSLKEMAQVINLCLLRNPNWVNAGKTAISNVTPERKAKYVDWVVTHSNVFDLCSIGKSKQAASQLSGVVNSVPEDNLKGYLMQSLAEIVNFYDQSEAQQTLLSGVQYNRNILKPIKGINYAKINSGSRSQSDIALDFYNSRYMDANFCLVEVESILSDLTFQEDTYKKFESAFAALGKLIGFDSQRPETDIGDGPDVLWATGDQNYFLIECKNGVKLENLVSKSHIGQLSHGVNWFEHHYGKTAQRTLIMIHPQAQLEAHAYASAEMRVIDKEGLEILKDSVRQYFQELCHDGSLYQVKKIQEKINYFGFGRQQFLTKYTRSFKK